MKVKPQEKTKKIKGYRKYNIPVDYSVKKLAQDLVRWLQAEHGQATECQEIEEGWLVQSQDIGSRLSRLVKRKAECIYIRLVCDSGYLNVSVTSEEASEPSPKADDKKFSLKTAASLVVNTTADWRMRLFRVFQIFGSDPEYPRPFTILPAGILPQATGRLLVLQHLKLLPTYPDTWNRCPMSNRPGQPDFSNPGKA